MKRLLNISTHGSDLDAIEDDWHVARQFVSRFGFDGFEVYPVDGYPLERVPSDLVVGVHLRFFVFLDALWHGKTEELRALFGDLETARMFYGRLDREAVVDAYRQQFRWAREVDAEYAVFHAGQADFRGLADWDFSWTWQSTVDLTAEIVNQATAGAVFEFPILFENLWWPGGLRLDHPEEIERLLSRVSYSNTGVALDTGHVLNKNLSLRDEAQGIEYLLQTVRDLGALRKQIRAIHLSRSLSGDYVRRSRAEGFRVPAQGSFRDRFIAARRHVSRIDEHEAFENPAIAKLFELVEPEFLVHEFTYGDRDQWCAKIERQNAALTSLRCQGGSSQTAVSNPG